MKEQSSALLSDIGSVLCRLGRLREGVDCFRRAADRQRELGLRQAEATSINNLGCAYLDLDEPRLAVECLRRAVELRSGPGNEAALAEYLANLGVALARVGHSAEALECLIRSRVIYEATGNRAAVETVAKLIPRVESNDRLDDRHAYGDPTNPTLPQTAEDFAETLRQAEEAESRHDFAEAARLYERMLGSRLYETSSIAQNCLSALASAATA